MAPARQSVAMLKHKHIILTATIFSMSLPAHLNFPRAVTFTYSTVIGQFVCQFRCFICIIFLSCYWSICSSISKFHLHKFFYKSSTRTSLWGSRAVLLCMCSAFCVASLRRILAWRVYEDCNDEQGLTSINQLCVFSRTKTQWRRDINLAS